MTFEELGLKKEIIDRLTEQNIKEPTAVQQTVIPMVAQKKNIMFQSDTGTGKTFAYLLPLVQHLEEEDNPKHSVRIMISTPTYELASQIKSSVQSVCNLKCALLIGGAPLNRQIEMLKEKPEIVIGGSARLLELIHLKKLKAEAVETLVLDEADRLLSKEMREETEGLLERLPKNVQLIGNSATVSEYTRKTLEKARDGMNKNENAEKIELITLPSANILRDKIEHWAIFAERREKIDTLRSFIHAENPEKLIVFTAKNDQIENIASKLRFKKIMCETLSGKMDKQKRKTAIDRFRSGKTKILITSDLAARGLDIKGITHVVQMDMNENEDFFIHRSGRTARAGNCGINLVIGDEVEMRRFAALEKKLGIIVYPKIIYKGKIESPQVENEQ